MSKFTKQGVRDLNHLPAKQVGRKFTLPPEQVDCKHPKEKQRTTSQGMATICTGCGLRWDGNGIVGI